MASKTGPDEAKSGFAIRHDDDKINSTVNQFLPSLLSQKLPGSGLFMIQVSYPVV
jgi:hypothetical protein